MKIALYIEDGLEQIVLTPESDTEKSILGKLSDTAKSQSRELRIHRGSFYSCQGGWVRHRALRTGIYDYAHARNDDESTIIVLHPLQTNTAVDEYQGTMEPDYDPGRDM